MAQEHFLIHKLVDISDSLEKKGQDARYKGKYVTMIVKDLQSAAVKSVAEWIDFGTNSEQFTRIIPHED